MSDYDNETEGHVLDELNPTKDVNQELDIPDDVVFNDVLSTEITVRLHCMKAAVLTYPGTASYDNVIAAASQYYDWVMQAGVYQTATS